MAPGKGKALALIDGHHYLHAIKAALQHAEGRMSLSLVGVVLLGPPGKLGSTESLAELELPVMTGSDDLSVSINEACDKFKPDAVIDLSGDPQLDVPTRIRIAEMLLSAGIVYIGPDFQFAPVQGPGSTGWLNNRAVCNRKKSVSGKTKAHLGNPGSGPAVPTLAVLGAGKRVGKTAVCAFAAGRIALAGMRPVIITMGRGGPVVPLLLRGKLTPEFLIAEQKQGRHAASDCYEEALLTGLPAIGCLRAGGGLAGSPFYTNVPEGTEMANSLDCDIQVYEGSGNTAPPVRIDASILVIGAAQPPELLKEPFGAAFIKRADLVIVTGCESPLASPSQIRELVETLRSINSEATIRTAVLRPQPVSEIKGKKVVLATTAPRTIIETLVSHLERGSECEIVGVTNAVSDRGRLKREITSLLGSGGKPEVLLTELKAASVQVAVPMALEAGMRVVFVSNVPQPVEPAGGDFGEDVEALTRLAAERYRVRHPIVTKD